MWQYIVKWTLVFVVSNYSPTEKKRVTQYYYCNNKIETLCREDAFIEYETAKSQPGSSEVYVTKVTLDSIFIN